jgi:hypothetical protein
MRFSDAVSLRPLAGLTCFCYVRAFFYHFSDGFPLKVGGFTEIADKRNGWLSSCDGMLKTPSSLE